ncbi:MAG: hypothetical protein ACLP4V_08115, partial [Methylocella sp.]
FRCIHANSANLFHGRSPLFEICNDLILAQSMPSGAVHPNTHCGHPEGPKGSGDAAQGSNADCARNVPSSTFWIVRPELSAKSVSKRSARLLKYDIVRDGEHLRREKSESACGSNRMHTETI